MKPEYYQGYLQHVADVYITTALSADSYKEATQDIKKAVMDAAKEIKEPYTVNIEVTFPAGMPVARVTVSDPSAG